MDTPEEMRDALERIVDQLGDLHPGARKLHADLVLRAIQMRCQLARADGEIIAPQDPGMRCVVNESEVGSLCPDCPAAQPLPGDTPGQS